jgi:hypothetical protein
MHGNQSARRLPCNRSKLNWLLALRRAPWPPTRRTSILKRYRNSNCQSSQTSAGGGRVAQVSSAYPGAPQPADLAEKRAAIVRGGEKAAGLEPEFRIVLEQQRLDSTVVRHVGLRLRRSSDYPIT